MNYLFCHEFTHRIFGINLVKNNCSIFFSETYVINQLRSERWCKNKLVDIDIVRHDKKNILSRDTGKLIWSQLVGFYEIESVRFTESAVALLIV